MKLKQLKKIDGTYHVAVAAQGRTKWISTGSNTKAEAEQIVADSGVSKLSQAAKAGSLTSRAIGQILTGKHLTNTKALAEYLKVKRASKAAKTVENHRIVLENWLKEMKLENAAPSAITASHIDKYINNQDSAWKRSTRSVTLAVIRTFFGFCAAKGWVVADPSRLVEVDYSILSHEQKEGGGGAPFSEDELRLLLHELRKDHELSKTGKHQLFKDAGAVIFWLVAVTVAKETGLRLSDIAQLEWRSFGEVDRLVVWTEKTNKRLEHQVSSGLQDLIALIPVSDATYIFPEQQATIRDVTKRAMLSVQFTRLLERVGIKGKSFHSLRHYKATHAFSRMDKNKLAQKLAESLSLSEIAALLGHSSTKTTKGYIH